MTYIVLRAIGAELFRTAVDYKQDLERNISEFEDQNFVLSLAFSMLIRITSTTCFIPVYMLV